MLVVVKHLEMCVVEPSRQPRQNINQLGPNDAGNSGAELPDNDKENAHAPRYEEFDPLACLVEIILRLNVVLLSPALVR